MDGRAAAASDDGLTITAHVVKLVRCFVALADTLGDDFEIDQHLEALVDACLRSLPVAGGAVWLVDSLGGPSVAASSDSDVEALGQLQLLLDDGPGLACLRDAGQSVVVRLAEESERWHGFVRAARAAGFGTMLAIPLRQNGETIGALELYDPAPQPLGTEHLELAEAFAEVAAIGMVQYRSRVRSNRRAEQLQRALTSRLIVEQAKGILSERGQISADESFERLRAFARSARHPLHDVAAAVVDRRLAADDVLGAQRPPGDN